MLKALCPGHMLGCPSGHLTVAYDDAGCGVLDNVLGFFLAQAPVDQDQAKPQGGSRSEKMEKGRVVLGQYGHPGPGLKVEAGKSGCQLARLVGKISMGIGVVLPDNGRPVFEKPSVFFKNVKKCQISQTGHEPVPLADGLIIGVQGLCGLELKPEFC